MGWQGQAPDQSPGTQSLPPRALENLEMGLTMFPRWPAPLFVHISFPVFALCHSQAHFHPVACANCFS